MSHTARSAARSSSTQTLWRLAAGSLTPLVLQHQCITWDSPASWPAARTVLKRTAPFSRFRSTPRNEAGSCQCPGVVVRPNITRSRSRTACLNRSAPSVPERETHRRPPLSLVPASCRYSRWTRTEPAHVWLPRALTEGSSRCCSSPPDTPSP